MGLFDRFKSINTGLEDLVKSLAFKDRILVANGQTIIWHYEKHLYLTPEEEINAKLTEVVTANPNFDRAQIAKALGIVIAGATDNTAENEIATIRQLFLKYEKIRLDNADLIAKDPSFGEAINEKFLQEKKKILGL